jgi:hypothetical protein
MQPSNLSDLHNIEHDQRVLDPIETIEHDSNPDRLGLLRDDIGRIDYMLSTDSTLTYSEKKELYDMGINLRLDWLYAEKGGVSLSFPQFEAEAKDIQQFITRAEEHVTSRRTMDPSDVWDIRIKNFDLTSFRAHRYLRESQTTLRGTKAGEQARTLANSKMQGALHGALAMMDEMQKVANGEGQLAQDTRGTIYELMITTYARYKTYENENFDAVFVRTALEREDRPWNKHAYPKRSFDVVIDAGKRIALLQTKNYDNKDEYAKPIRKVKDPKFGNTLDDIHRYIADFKYLLSDHNDPSAQPLLQKASRDLDKIFGTQIGSANLLASA